jgi:hypothetical protein
MLHCCWGAAKNRLLGKLKQDTRSAEEQEAAFKRERDAFYVARHNADVTLQFTLVSALAWLVAVAINGALEQSIGVHDTCDKIGSNFFFRHGCEYGAKTVKVVLSWVTVIACSLISLLVLYIHRRLLYVLHKHETRRDINNALDDLSAPQEATEASTSSVIETKKKKRPSLPSVLIDMSDQTMIFLALSSLKTVSIRCRL